MCCSPVPRTVGCHMQMPMTHRSNAQCLASCACACVYQSMCACIVGWHVQLIGGPRPKTFWGRVRTYYVGTCLVVSDGAEQDHFEMRCEAAQERQWSMDQSLRTGLPEIMAFLSISKQQDDLDRGGPLTLWLCVTVCRGRTARDTARPASVLCRYHEIGGNSPRTTMPCTAQRLRLLRLVSTFPVRRATGSGVLKASGFLKPVQLRWADLYYSYRRFSIFTNVAGWQVRTVIN
jgi:hypothetical protein